MRVCLHAYGPQLVLKVADNGGQAPAFAGPGGLCWPRPAQRGRPRHGAGRSRRRRGRARGQQHSNGLPGSGSSAAAGQLKWIRGRGTGSCGGDSAKRGLAFWRQPNGTRPVREREAPLRAAYPIGETALKRSCARRWCAADSNPLRSSALPDWINHPFGWAGSGTQVSGRSLIIIPIYRVSFKLWT